MSGSATTPEEAQHWSLDKRIPIALILTVAISTVTGVGTAAIAHYRLGVLERTMERREELVERRFSLIEEARLRSERETASRDGAVREALAELRGATAGLRDAVSDLRVALRALEQRPNSQQRHP
jgi:hypothetical protein